MRLEKKIMILFIAIAGYLPIYSQVTIGSEEAPVSGALLDLKERADGTSDKGLIFPRVALSHKNDLRPMFTSGAPQNQKSTHTGLVVFNIYSGAAIDVPTFLFQEGLYVWSGSEWKNISSAKVQNGLSMISDVIQLGGNLTENTTISMNDKDFAVVTGSKNMNVIGGLASDSLFLTKLPSDGGSTRSLTVNVTTGRVELAAGVKAKLAFYQSGDESRTPGINTGDVQVVPWKESDRISNNIVTFNASEDSFILDEDAMIEISAMVCYKGSNSGSTIVNATLQMKKKGESTWEDYSSVRGVYPSSVNAYRNTLNIPPAMVDAKQGDAIRLVVLRPPNEGGGGYLGGAHSTGSTNGIVRPYGTQFSKMIKIIVQ